MKAMPKLHNEERYFFQNMVFSQRKDSMSDKALALHVNDQGIQGLLLFFTTDGGGDCQKYWGPYDAGEIESGPLLQENGFQSLRSPAP